MKARVIAFYLPQYHPTPDNDRWWGSGFTEWTNVGKAKPLFRGHYQPKVPADLGYYDLRVPEVREQQAELARQAGIEGFCYYHYWFGNGKMELERPFEEVLKTGKPNFPFCLCWANESWHSKFWNTDGSIKKQLLIEQTYPGDDDIIRHFYHLLPAFKDHRYIKVDGKPLFMVYRAQWYPEVSRFIKMWNELAKDNGLDGFFFTTQISSEISDATVDMLLSKGFDAVNTNELWAAISKKGAARRLYRLLCKVVLGMPNVMDYKLVYQDLVSEIGEREDVFPTLLPNWDHTPRSGRAGFVLNNATPELFKKHVHLTLEKIQGKSESGKVLFLKSWNEWGEGNYMEPDLRYGRGFLDALGAELKDYSAFDTSST